MNGDSLTAPEGVQDRSRLLVVTTRLLAVDRRSVPIPSSVKISSSNT